MGGLALGIDCGRGYTHFKQFGRSIPNTAGAIGIDAKGSDLDLPAIFTGA
jgi:hypothetical protein